MCACILVYVGVCIDVCGCVGVWVCVGVWACRCARVGVYMLVQIINMKKSDWSEKGK